MIIKTNIKKNYFFFHVAAKIRTKPKRDPSRKRCHVNNTYLVLFFIELHGNKLIVNKKESNTVNVHKSFSFSFP